MLIRCHKYLAADAAIDGYCAAADARHSCYWRFDDYIAPANHEVAADLCGPGQSDISAADEHISSYWACDRDISAADPEIAANCFVDHNCSARGHQILLNIALDDYVTAGSQQIAGHIRCNRDISAGRVNIAQTFARNNGVARCAWLNKLRSGRWVGGKQESDNENE